MAAALIRSGFVGEAVLQFSSPGQLRKRDSVLRKLFAIECWLMEINMVSAVVMRNDLQFVPFVIFFIQPDLYLIEKRRPDLHHGLGQSATLYIKEANGA